MIRDVAFSPDRQTLAAAHPDGHVRLWSISQGKELAAIRCPKPVFCLAFYPHGGSLVTGSDGDTLVRRWDVASGKCTGEFQTNADWNSVSPVAFSPGGKTLVTNGKGGSLLLLEA